MRKELPRNSRLAVSLALALLLAIATVAALTVLKPNARILYDEQSHHLPAIRLFASQLPSPDLRDYAVATTPGYHLLMASARRYAGFELPGLRAINIGLAMAMAGLVGGLVARRLEPSTAIALALPLILCVYVLASAAWLLPENAAWALVTLLLTLALERTTRTTLVLMGVALVLLVLVRQAHAWCAALILAAAVLDATDARTRLQNTGLAVAACLPAAGVLTAFVLLWHGLVPPLFQPGGREYELSSQYGGWGPAAGAFTLALLGFLGAPLVPWFWRGARSAAGRWFWHIVVLGAALALLISILPETAYEAPHRRSGIWRLVQLTPSLGDRSPLLIALATCGGAVTSIALAAQATRTRVLLLTAIIAFAIAQTANPMIWQRYYEPMVLLWLVAAVAYAERPTTLRAERALQWTGLAGLTLFQVAVTLYTLRGGGD